MFAHVWAATVTAAMVHNVNAATVTAAMARFVGLCMFCNVSTFWVRRETAARDYEESSWKAADQQNTRSESNG